MAVRAELYRHGTAMPARKPKTRQNEVVSRFAVRLKEVRSSRGFTQAELASAAKISPAYLWRLESGSVTPGIDLVARLAGALETTIGDLLPSDAPEPVDALKQRAKEIFERVLEDADQPTLMMLCPLLARIGEGPSRKR